MGLVEHLESHLGELTPLGSFTSDEAPGQRLHIVGFYDQPRGGVTTVASVGLSHHRLGEDGADPVRQEFVAVCQPDWTDAAAGMLANVVCEALGRHEPLLAGMTFSVGQQVADRSTIHGFLAWHPVPFASEFEIVHYGSDDHVVLTWLVPLTVAEITFVRRQSGDAVLQLMDDQGTDVADLARAGVVLP